MKIILVTGGAGFIGSNFIKHILGKYPDYVIINVDLLTYAGNLINLKDIKDNHHYHFIQADIRNRKIIEEIFRTHDIDVVVNFAAETHVDRSIEDPEVFLTTNILGTNILVDVAMKNWKMVPSDKYDKRYKAGVKFLQISTDEVYGSLNKKGSFVETMSLMPNSPYAASKASADMIVRAYKQTYGVPVNIARCCNNYGPYQFPEKLIPLTISNCLRGRELPVYGDGLQIRDWLYVPDHCSALDLILHKGIEGDIYNIGNNNEKSNIEIVRLIVKRLGMSEKLIRFVRDRPGHDRRYAINNTKITTQLGWKPDFSFEVGLDMTIQWYIDNQEWLESIIPGEYEEYYQKMYSHLIE
jgi:dTDP-glucose 4,6-dehydratase